MPFPIFSSLPATLWSDQHRAFPYQKYKVTVAYLWNTGALQLPVAQPTPGVAAIDDPGPQGARTLAAVCQTSAAYGKKVVSWVAERDGDFPHVPHPIDPTDDNAVLETFVIETESPDLLPEGVDHAYRVRGTYTYILKEPIWATDGLPMGGTPYDNTPDGLNVLPPTSFDVGLTP